MNIIRYDLNTGKILQSGNIPDGMLHLQGEGFLEGVGDTDSHYVDLSTLEIKPLPPKPAPLGVIFDFESHQWIPDVTYLSLFTKIRRNELLQSTDWTQLPDVPLETKEAWAIYRQQLRDITSQPDYPVNVIWPEKP